MSSNWPWEPRTRSNTNPLAPSWEHKKSPFSIQHKTDLNQLKHEDDDAPPMVNPIPSWLLDDSDYADLKPTPVVTAPMSHPQASGMHHVPPMPVPMPVPPRAFTEELEQARRHLQELQALEALSKENVPQTQSRYEPEVFTANAQWDAPIQHSSFSAPLSTPFWDRLAASSAEDTSANVRYLVCLNVS